MFFCFYVYTFTFLRAFHTLFCLFYQHTTDNQPSFRRAYVLRLRYVYATFTDTIRYVTDNIYVTKIYTDYDLR